MTLRISGVQPPQEPTPEPANYDTLWVLLGGGIIVAIIIAVGRLTT